MYLKFFAVLKLENFIRTFVAEFFPGVGVNVTHHKINLLLRVLSQIGSFWKDSPDHFVVVFTAPFLVRGAGVAVEHSCSTFSLCIQFDCGRI